MSDTNESTTNIDTNMGDETEESTNTEGNEQLDKVRKVGREAAANRAKLREAEAANEAMLNQLTDMQRGTIATHLESIQSFKPELLELAGHAPGDFFTETGTFDPEAVKTAIDDISERFGIFTGSMVKYVNLGGDGSESLTGQTDWSSALKNHL